MVLGCHTRKKPTKQAMDTTAAITSTNSGPMKLDTKNCMMAKLKPVTKIAGHTSHMARRPAKAQISQNGTSKEKKGSWRPTIMETCMAS